MNKKKPVVKAVAKKLFVLVEVDDNSKFEEHDFLKIGTMDEIMSYLEEEFYDCTFEQNSMKLYELTNVKSAASPYST